MNNLYLIDCLLFMKDKPDNYYDLGIIDPEYGRGESGGVNRSGYVKQKNGSKLYVDGNKYKNKNWDTKPADKIYFDELFRVTKNQIIWGCNYYYTNFGSGRIIWDKCNEGTDQSDCEIAYNSTTSRIDKFTYMWRGMMQGKSITEGHIQQGNKKLNETRVHPTQKPVALYKWLLTKYAKPGNKILDTHSGSGSLRIACHDLGFYLDSCEIDKDYYRDNQARYEQHTQQTELFEKQEIQELTFRENKEML